MKKTVKTTDEFASKLIDARINELADSRGKALAYIRSLIIKAVPDVVEEWQWRGVPVWSHGGQIYLLLLMTWSL